MENEWVSMWAVIPRLKWLKWPQGSSFYLNHLSYVWYPEWLTPGVTALRLVFSSESTPFAVNRSSAELQPQISFIVAVKLLLLSRLQWVSFSAMMEELGITLRCYQGIRRRSRPYCRAKSECVLCQPRSAPKRVQERRDSSTWAQQTGLICLL